MKWRTKFTEITKVQYPVIMGAFAGLGRASFAAPFSNAGGLGIITALNFNSAERFKKELKAMKDLTDKPFGVNFTIAPPMLAKKNPKARTEETYFDFLDIAVEMGVEVFTTSAYQAKKLGERIHEYGCYWFHKCSVMEHALSAERAGADMITLVGVEGTGFKNPLQQSTLVNITMGNKLLDIPLIAAGGIGNARGFLASLFMGASAVCFGTAIMATKECPASDKLKKRLVNQDIFEEEYYQQIYHHQLKDKSIWSPAAGHCDEVLTIKEFMDKIIGEAEDLLIEWGFKKEQFNTL
ncbi:MAG: Nitronate monooxygenase [Promethearchaeota archaeon]|nr:MAG: Nitronate monooxygenase [Candidatus Lokiarchaeota archaeon]